MAYLNAVRTSTEGVGQLAGRQTAFDSLASGVADVKLIEQRLYSLMDRLVGTMPEDACVAQSPREPGLFGDIGEAGRDLGRVTDAMRRYLDAIERALP